MFYKYQVETGKVAAYIISDYVREAVKESGVKNGIAVVYGPHTSCGITINENAGPDVTNDLIYSFEKVFPRLEEYKHCDSEEHIRTSVCGSSVTVIIEENEIVLGKWQDIFYCEFHPERSPRDLYVKVISD